MRGSVTAAIAAILLLGAAVQAAEDPGHRFAPSLAQAYVAAIQRQLAERGYFTGPATGLVTPRTRAAIAAYQKDVGLPADGIADMAVINMLNFGPRVYAGGAAPPPPAPAANQPPPLASAPLPAPPDIGQAIRELQTALAASGLYAGAVDGRFTPQTLDALHAYGARLAAIRPPPAVAMPAPPPPSVVAPAAIPQAKPPTPPSAAPEPKASTEAPAPLASPRPGVSAAPLAPPGPAAKAPPPALGHGPILPIDETGPRPRSPLPLIRT